MLGLIGIFVSAKYAIGLMLYALYGRDYILQERNIFVTLTIEPIACDIIFF